MIWINFISQSYADSIMHDMCPPAELGRGLMLTAGAVKQYFKCSEMLQAEYIPMNQVSLYPKVPASKIPGEGNGSKKQVHVIDYMVNVAWRLL